MGHTLLRALGLPGYTLPAFTSTELGAIGGLLLALPILSLRTLPQDLSDSLQTPIHITFFSSVVVVGGLQGYVGAKVLNGYKIILGVGCATLAGATGALMLVIFVMALFAVVSMAAERTHERQRRDVRIHTE